MHTGRRRRAPRPCQSILRYPIVNLDVPSPSISAQVDGRPVGRKCDVPPLRSLLIRSLLFPASSLGDYDDVSGLAYSPTPAKCKLRDESTGASAIFAQHVGGGVSLFAGNQKQNVVLTHVLDDLLRQKNSQPIMIASISTRTHL